MTLLDVEKLQSKLRELHPTQIAIEQVSSWCQFYRKDARLLVQTWLEELQSAEQPRKLSLVFLANDILQNGRKKGQEFMQEFYRVLPEALKHVAKHTTDKTKQQIKRVVRIWEERRVFGPVHVKSFMGIFENTYEDEEEVKPVSAANQEKQDDQKPQIMYDLLRKFQPISNLVGALADVQQSAQLSQSYVSQMQGVLRQGMLQDGDVSEISVAVDKVKEMVMYMEAEVKARQRAHDLLSGILSNLTTDLQEAKDNHQLCVQQQQMLQQRLQQMQQSKSNNQEDQEVDLQSVQQEKKEEGKEVLDLAQNLADSGKAADLLAQALTTLSDEDQQAFSHTLMRALQEQDSPQMG